MYHAAVERIVGRGGDGVAGHAEQDTDARAQQIASHLAEEVRHHRAEAAAAMVQMRYEQASDVRRVPVLGGVTLLLVAVCLRRLTLQRRQLAALHEAAHVSSVTDDLTGLANRAGLHAALGAALSATGPDRQVALLLLDLNGFKIVNDTFGHELGDDVLRAVASRLRKTVPDTALVARLGGDEFVVLLPDVADQAEVEGIAGRTDTALAPPTASRSPLAGASIGVSMADGRGGDVQVVASELLRQAGIAMYASKPSRSGPVFFTPVRSAAEC